MFTPRLHSRTALLVAAVACYAGAAASAAVPRGPAFARTIDAPQRRVAARSAPVPAVTLVRDPFAAAPDDDPGTPRPIPSPVALPQRVSPASAPPRLLAVVTGPEPTAIVDEGGRSMVVTLHTRISGSEVVAIDDAGVCLSDGRTLSIATTGTAAR